MPLSSRSFTRRLCQSHLGVRSVFASVVVMIFAVSDAWASNWFVEVGGSQLAFSPAALNISPGDTVTFMNLGGLHNVVADDGSFRCAHGCDGDGTGGNGSPNSMIWFATVDFPNSGSFGYFCEVHGSPGVGMYGTIHVLAAPPPPPQTLSIVPSGGWVLSSLLVGALITSAAVHMRRYSRAHRSTRQANTHPRNLR